MEPIDFIVECPHCKNPVLIEKLNCCIFRHGILKHNLSKYLLLLFASKFKT